MEEQVKINPWTHMWTSPKETMRYLLPTNPKKGFWFFSFIYFFTSFTGLYAFALSTLQSSPQGFSVLGFILRVLIAIFVSTIAGAILLSLEAFITWVSGKILGGKAKWIEVRCAVSWAKIPILILFLTNGIFFPAYIPLMNLGKVVSGIWVIVLWVAAIAETQKFSTARAIGNFFMNFLAFLLLGMLLGIILYFLGLLR